MHVSKEILHSFLNMVLCKQLNYMRYDTDTKYVSTRTENMIIPKHFNNQPATSDSRTIFFEWYSKHGYENRNQ